MTRAQIIALAMAAIDPDGCRVCHARWELCWYNEWGFTTTVSAKVIRHRDGCAVVAAQTEASEQPA